LIKLVLFDLDDTLISEYEFIKSGFSHISDLLSQKYNIEKEKIYRELMDLFNIDRSNIFDQWFTKKGLVVSKEYILYLVNEYRNHIPKISFYDDVIPSINILKHNNIKIGIVTDGYQESQKRKLNCVKAYDYFDKIYITDEYGKDYWKPSKLIFEHIMAEYNVTNNELVYIGDNPSKDFYISLSLGIKTIRIIRKDSIYKDHPYYKGVKENYHSDSIYDIINYILEL
jgi:putative hydrolase of the HAD superfamily